MHLVLLWWLLGTIALDQLSKFIVSTIAPESVILNRAVAFSFPAPTWVVWGALVVLVGLAVYEWFQWSGAARPKRAWSLGLLIGGALSNLIDRLLFGGVRDFIDLRVWPVFNLADVALTVGTIALIWYSLRSSHLATSHGEPTRASTPGRRPPSRRAA